MVSSTGMDHAFLRGEAKHRGAHSEWCMMREAADQTASIRHAQHGSPASDSQARRFPPRIHSFEITDAAQ